MKNNPLIIGLAGCLTGAAASPLYAAEKKTESRKPNVVFILADDLGSADLNCYGSNDLHTPNIDKLAAQGVRFTRFYANSSVSAPSRAAIYTGRYPHRVGVAGNIPPQPDAVGLPPSETTIAEALRDNGYATALIGKWHQGHAPGSTPNAQGFGYYFGHMGGCIDNYSHFFYWNGPNRHDLYRNGEEIWRPGENFADMMVRESLAFIEKNKDRPFFLFFASNYPHYPLQGDAKWREYYKDTPSPRNMYAAMVSTLDEKVGMIVDKLEREGLRENTIIVFMSDNGHSTEERSFFGGGNAGGLRGEKFSVYDGGVRIPAILSYPARVASGIMCDAVGAGFDWYPTLLDLCGAPQPEHHLDGASLMPCIDRGAPSPHETLNWQVNTRWAVLKGDYKLVSVKERAELYDLSADRGETTNLASRMPEKVRELQAVHDAWLEEMK